MQMSRLSRRSLALVVVAAAVLLAASEAFAGHRRQVRVHVYAPVYQGVHVAWSPYVEVCRPPVTRVYHPPVVVYRGSVPAPVYVPVAPPYSYYSPVRGPVDFLYSGPVYGW